MPDLETPRLNLCDFRNEDFEDVHAYASDPEVTRQLSWGPNTPAETRDFLERAQRGILEVPRESFDWAITRKSDGRVIGGCGLYRRTGNKAEFELGYCLSRPTWGQGFGKEMVNVVLEYGLSTLRARRIIALIFPGNERSVGLAKSAGFVFEEHVIGKRPTFSEDQPLLLYVHRPTH